MYEKQRNTFLKKDDDEQGRTASKEMNLSQDEIKKMREIIKEDIAWRQEGARDNSTYVLKGKNLKK